MRHIFFELQTINNNKLAEHFHMVFLNNLILLIKLNNSLDRVIFQKMTDILEALNEEFICPILRVQIEDPVLTEDGHTYEREAIENWLKTSRKSPITGLMLRSRNLFPNIAFKNIKNKINELIPNIIKKNKSLQQDNTKLKTYLQQLKQNLSDERQLNISKQLLFQQQLKQLKIQQNKQIRKQMQLQRQITDNFVKKEQIQQLQNKLYLFQKQIKYQKQRSQQKILQLQRKAQKEKSQIRWEHKIKLLEIQHNRRGDKFYMCTMINQVANLILGTTYCILNEIQNSQGKKKDILIELQQKTQEFFQNTSEWHLSNLRMYRFIASLSYKENNLVSFYPVIPYYHQEILNVLSVQTFLKVNEVIKTKKQINQKDFETYRKLIKGIKSDVEKKSIKKKINDQQWKEIVLMAQSYQNIEFIYITDSQIQNISKEDLKRFTNLKYLNLSDHQLNKESQKALEQYQNQHPEVQIIHSKAFQKEDY